MHERIQLAAATFRYGGEPHRYAKDYDESKHHRDEGGKFAHEAAADAHSAMQALSARDNRPELNSLHRQAADEHKLTAALHAAQIRSGTDRYSKQKDPSFSAEHAEECCPSCGARQERSDDGKCNRCGKEWPESKTSDEESEDTMQYGGTAMTESPVVGALRVAENSRWGIR